LIKFKNKLDGSVFNAEPSSILFSILENDKNYEVVKEVKKPTKKAATKK